jgi:signal transduction histidine kinase
MKISNSMDQKFLKTLTVLYVEDDADTRQQFADFLSRPGVEAFKKHLPDIVITDILMPRMDGLTMAKEILDLVPSVPVIVVTAFEQTDYMMRAINIGIDKYVTKPVNSYQLFESLLECARRLRAEQELKLKHQREIQAARSKHNETAAILARGMAHDYNFLMQSILGYASLAKMTLEPGSQADGYLEQVEKCSDEARDLGLMLRILGNDYSDSTHPGPVLPCILESIGAAVTGTEITFQFNYSDNLPDVLFSDQQLKLVFTGLAINAVESMPSGGTLQLQIGTIVITEQDTVPVEPGGYLYITLTDSGVGIAHDILPKIFDPYFSTKLRSTKRGMGLNLALCRTVIMGYGGMLAAESTPGSGTTIKIWLPIVHAQV